MASQRSLPRTEESPQDQEAKVKKGTHLEEDSSNKEVHGTELHVCSEAMRRAGGKDSGASR